jgi:hypothetical protein
LVKQGKPGLNEGLETAAVAAAGGAALKAVGKLGEKVTARLEQAVDISRHKGQPARQA